MRRKQRDEFGLPIRQVAGFALLFAALLVSFVLFPGIVQPFLGVLVAAAGAGKAIMEFFEGPPNDELPPASRRFRQLSDPERPLEASNPIPVTPGAAGEDVTALLHARARPADGTTNGG